jgi:hypothetical protein
MRSCGVSAVKRWMVSFMTNTCTCKRDRIDLAKIWPDLEIDRLEQRLNERHRLYAARFNDVHSGAVPDDQSPDPARF